MLNVDIDNMVTIIYLKKTPPPSASYIIVFVNLNVFYLCFCAYFRCFFYVFHLKTLFCAIYLYICVFVLLHMRMTVIHAEFTHHIPFYLYPLSLTLFFVRETCSFCVFFYFCSSSHSECVLNLIIHPESKENEFLESLINYSAWCLEYENRRIIISFIYYLD